MSSTDLNQKIKAAAEPGVYEVIAWALKVHEDTMARLEGRLTIDLLNPSGQFSVYEREEARKILLEYGAGKPTRIVEHRGNKRAPIAFETTVVKRLSAKEPDTTVIDAEFTE